MVSSRLEGENVTGENSDQLKSTKSVNENAPPVTATAPSNQSPSDHLGPNFETPPNGALRHSSRQCTESPYNQMLRSRVGTHNGRGGDPLLPRGIQAADNERGGVSEPDECTSMAWELNDENAVFALLAGITKAKGLEPMTIDEAKMRPDWPRWEEVINAELKSLEDAHTWNVVECPRNTNVVIASGSSKLRRTLQAKSTSTRPVS